jgi:hypothetical protein
MVLNIIKGHKQALIQIQAENKQDFHHIFALLSFNETKNGVTTCVNAPSIMKFNYPVDPNDMNTKEVVKFSILSNIINANSKDDNYVISGEPKFVYYFVHAPNTFYSFTE